ncbi:uncharacterized protein LOC128724027 [Anopheles nili]|uniref:uncharacterized protein LOC128724027 n=1 Tax=Anopheles nili TaxID=185578 RepID=UPI00237A0F7C|nr:uncharacterized protein LOC128724027 [Anopheles nili]
MNGICLIVPKAKKYQILHHLLKPLQPTSWILLLLAFVIGSLLAKRYFKNDLVSSIIFGVDLNSSNISKIERIVLFSSVFGFFVLSVAYQAKLLAFMSSFRYRTDPKTVDEFLQTDIMLQSSDVTGVVVLNKPKFKGRFLKWTEPSDEENHDYGVLKQCNYAWDHMVHLRREQYKRYGYNDRLEVHIVGEKILSLTAA